MARPERRPRSARISACPSAIVSAEMRGARREIGVVQIIGLHPRLDEAAHQRLQRLDVVVDALQQHALADHRDAGVDQPPAGGARLGRQLARMVGVQRDIDGLVVAAASAPSASAGVTRSGAATGSRVCQRSTLTCAIVRRAPASTSASRRGDSASGSPPVSTTSQISGRARI